MNNIEIVEVRSRKQLREFLDFPKTLYFDVLRNPHFVMPIRLISKIQIGSLKSERKRLLIAKEDGKVLARVGLYMHQHSGLSKLHFGFFECMPGRVDAAKALFDYGRQLFPNLEIVGPYSFRMEDPYMGMLVEGFEHDPYFFMPYNADYYDEYLKACGLNSLMDVVAWDIKRTQPHQELFDRARQCEEEGYSIRWMTKQSMKRDVQTIARIFNDALSENWGFEELIEQQVREMYMMFKIFVDPDLVCFAHKDGKDVGCGIAIPNFNPAIKPGMGALSPKVIWNVLTGKKRQESVRGYALGALREHHNKGIGSLLLLNAWIRAQNEIQYQRAQFSWVLTGNDSMNKLAGKLNGEANCRYRIYSSQTNENVS